MKKKIPSVVEKEIKALAFKEADRANYLTSSRTENGMFLNNLVNMEQIGGRVGQYIEKEKVRTYIKDAILNRYSKARVTRERPDSAFIIEQRISATFHFVESEQKKGISLYKSPAKSCYILLADGSLIKWETALRKALLYIASRPFSNDPNISTIIILTLFAKGRKICNSDMKILEKALSKCNAEPYIYGQS